MNRAIPNQERNIPGNGTHPVRDENTLLIKAHKLDREALAQIHDQYYAAIYRYFSFRISVIKDVEDLTSEVFTRFLHALQKPSHVPQTIRGWLYGTAANLCKEYYRNHKNLPAELDDSLPDYGKSPEQLTEDLWAHRKLREAIQTLTEDQQTILTLRFGEEMPIRDVARLVNKTEGAVKMLQVRAISSLTRCLMDERNHEIVSRNNLI